MPVPREFRRRHWGGEEPRVRQAAQLPARRSRPQGEGTSCRVNPPLPPDSHQPPQGGFCLCVAVAGRGDDYNPPDPRWRPVMSEILVPVSFGELLDKIAILQIKSERMRDAAKLANVRNELSALETSWMAHPAAGHDIVRLRAELKAVNERLWVIEDDIRLKEQAQSFDDAFVQLARSVYIENDERARIKKEINLALGSSYVEEKSYQDYRATGA